MLFVIFSFNFIMKSILVITILFCVVNCTLYGYDTIASQIVSIDPPTGNVSVVCPISEMVSLSASLVYHPKVDVWFLM